MIVSLSLAILGALLAVPFVWAISRASKVTRVLQIWLLQLAVWLALWGLLVAIFYSRLIVRQDLRVVATVVINLFWVGLVLSAFLAAAAAVVRSIQLRARLRKSGK